MNEFVRNPFRYFVKWWREIYRPMNTLQRRKNNCGQSHIIKVQPKMFSFSLNMRIKLFDRNIEKAKLYSNWKLNWIWCITWKVSLCCSKCARTMNDLRFEMPFILVFFVFLFCFKQVATVAIVTVVQPNQCPMSEWHCFGFSVFLFEFLYTSE